MAAVDDLGGAVRADADQDEGDELLLHARVVVVVQRPVEADGQPAGHPLQRGLLVGGLAERAEHGGGRLDRVQPLAPDVADHRPDAVPGVDHLVEVTADPGLGGCGGVVHGRADAADPVRDGAQQHPAGDLGDQLGVGEGLLLPQPQGGADPADRGDQDDREDGGAVHGLAERVAVEGHQERRRLGAEADEQRVPGAAADHGGQRGDGGEGRFDRHLGVGEVVQGDHQGHADEGQRERCPRPGAGPARSASGGGPREAFSDPSGRAQLRSLQQKVPAPVGTGGDD